MRTVFFLSCCLLAFSSVFSQRPDSVQVNGQWYFVYPIRAELEPSEHYLRVVGLNETEFRQYRDWVQAKDPRLGLAKDSLVNALRKSIIDDKILTTQQFSDITEDYWEKQFHQHHSWFKLSRKFSIRRKLRHISRGYHSTSKTFSVRRTVNTNELRRVLLKSPERQHQNVSFGDYAIPPSEKNLPDGNYILYYDDFFTADSWEKWKLNPLRTAAVFSLKDNLPDGNFEFFSYEGKLLVTGAYANGLRQGDWQIRRESYYGIDYKEGWFFNRKYRKGGLGLDSLLLHFEFDLLDGECSYFSRVYASEEIEKDWSGHFKNGLPDGAWYHTELSEVIFKGDIKVVKDSTNRDYLTDWIEIIASRSDSLYNFSGLQGWNGYRHLWYSEEGKCTENGGLSSLNRIKDRPLNEFVQSQFPVGKTIKYQSFDTYCELFSETKPGLRVARFYRNKELKLITGSRYFDNGAIFDTCGFNDQGELIYKQFDNTGKLYVTSWLDQKGKHVRSVYTTPRKKKMIDGFEVINDLYSTGFSWEGDTLVSGKRFFNINWDEKSKRSYEDYYDIAQQQLVAKSYDEKGAVVVLKTIPFSTEAMAKFEADYEDKTSFWEKSHYLTNRILDFDSYQKQITWDDLTFLEENTGGTSKVTLFVNGQPYNGQLELKTGGRHKSRYKIKRDKLVIELRGRVRGRFSRFRYSDPKIGPGVSYEIQQNLPVFFQLKLYGPDPYMRPTLRGINSVSFSYTNSNGAIQNGIPAGDWVFYEYTKKPGAEMTYSGENSSGFTYEHKIRRKDYDSDLEEYISDPLKEQYQPACRKAVSYTFRKTAIANRRREGACVAYNHVGDTIGLAWYKNGELHGDQWYTLINSYSDDRDTDREYRIGKFVNGKADGRHILVEQEYVSAVGGGRLETDTLAVVNFVNGKREGEALYEPGTTLFKLSFTNDWPDRELTIKSMKGETVEHYLFRDGYVDKMQYFKENTLSYEYKLPEKDSFRLELSDLDEMTKIANPDFEDPYDWVGDREKYIKRDEIPKESVFTKFYPTGTIARTGKLTDKEKKTGRWTYASEDQGFRYVIDYKDSVYIHNSDTFSIIGVQTLLNIDGKALKKQLVLKEDDFYKCTSDEYYSIREYIVPEMQNTSAEAQNYYDNGTLMSRGQLVNGLPDGLWQFFNQQGGLTRTGIYKNGKKIGRWLEGDLNTKAYLGDICLDESNPDLDVIISQLERGKKLTVTVYRNGKAVSKQTYESSK